MSNSNLPGAFICLQFSAKTTSLTALCMMLILGISCNNSGKNEKTKQDSTKLEPTAVIEQDTSEAKAISNTLFILYLRNSKIKELVGETPGGDQSVVFNFYRDKDGYIGLAAWPTKKGKREFTGKEIRLERYKDSGESLYKQDIRFGELQLGPIARQKLRDKIKNPAFEYIIFKPVPERENKYKGHIVYRIFGTPSLDALDKNLQTQLIDYTNPSPPRNSEEEYE